MSFVGIEKGIKLHLSVTMTENSKFMKNFVSFLWNSGRYIHALKYEISIFQRI